jgi:hypothetical protein
MPIETASNEQISAVSTRPSNSKTLFRRIVMTLKNKFKHPVAIAVVATCISPTYAALPTRLIGEPVATSAATRTILITADTKWVNVTGGEAVRFIVGDHEFAVNFDAPLADGDFDLAQVAPAGTLTHRVHAYLARNPLYEGR